MKYITSFVTKIVETWPKAELGLLVHVHENYQAKQKTKEQWLIPCWVPRVWSESGPVFKVCVLPWFLTQSKSSPTEGLLQLHKSVSKSQVPAMFEDMLISYILWTQNFGFKQKINYLGLGFFMFFFLLQPFVIGWLQDFISHRPELHAPRLNDTSSIAMSPRKLVPLIPSKTT